MAQNQAKPDIEIRRALASDIEPMAEIINNFAEQGVMLHRSLSELYERVRDYQVAIVDNKLVGMAGLRVMWSNLAEIYGLAIAEGHQGLGLGRRLVESTISDAENLGIHKVFALTYEQTFFERCGFEVVNRHSLPLKVWSECLRCPKNDACDEIAVVKTLDHIPNLVKPIPQSEQQYEVPVRSQHVKIRLPDGRESTDL